MKKKKWNHSTKKNLKNQKKKKNLPTYQQNKKILHLLQNCIGPTIRIGQEILCIAYAE